MVSALLPRLQLQLSSTDMAYLVMTTSSSVLLSFRLSMLMAIKALMSGTSQDLYPFCANFFWI